MRNSMFSFITAILVAASIDSATAGESSKAYDDMNKRLRTGSSISNRPTGQSTPPRESVYGGQKNLPESYSGSGSSETQKHRRTCIDWNFNNPSVCKKWMNLD